MSTTINTSRRDFLKHSTLAGGGLIVGIPLMGLSQTASGAEKQNLAPNAILQITSENIVNFYLPRSEMGQGVYTGLTTLLAEELDVSPSKVTIHQTGSDDEYANPEFGMQITGGSTSIKAHFLPIRQLAANARLVIRQAAAKQLNVSLETIQTQDGKIFIQGKTLAYGEFVDVASTLDFPEDTPLKLEKDFKYIGKYNQRLDAQAKSTGTAEFGLDVDFDGLQKAAIKHCPVYGGLVQSFDDSAAKNMAGVKAIVAIHNGVAVVAEHYYQAKNALAKIEVQWQLPEKLSSFSTHSMDANNGMGLFENALKQEGDNAHNEGDSEAIKQTNKVISAQYWAPYLAHATMEPMNCTVKIENGKVDVWVGSQSPGMAKNIAALFADVAKDDVTVHSTFLGGGFGRRSASDFVAEATAIAKASNLPVQLTWSREDDTQHDLYRPASLAKFDIGLNQDGTINSWHVKRVGPNIMPYMIDEAVDAIAPGFMPNTMVDWLSKRGYGLFDGWVVDPSSVEGLFEDYDSPNKQVNHVTIDPGLPLGFWRSVGHSYSGFFKESMMDEVAVDQKQDAVAYRLKHLKNNPRLAHVLKLVAEKSGWGKPLANDHFHGLATHTSFGSCVAQVAEISVSESKIQVHKVTCVIDCGTAVNPEIIKAQMEGGIIFGLTAALHGEITLKDGAVEQTNFHTYPMLRMNESPEFDVIVVQSNEAPTGVGEPGLPPIAAAVANGVFAATGRRLRSLPLKLA
jgi:CO/xanthine dehydrogenase Mo-binding subunit